MGTYVMSDVHGLKDHYDVVLKAPALQNEDTLFVLGDVIDRGRDGIAILLNIMNRDNIYMLLRDHEYIMKQYYEAVHHMVTGMQEAWVVANHWRRNHCNPTIDAFERPNERKRHGLLDCLDGLPIIICGLRVYGELFCLTHGSAQPQFMHGIVIQQDVKDSDVTIERLVWDRMDVHERLFNDRSVTAGHTPTLFLQETHPYAIWTDTGDIRAARIMDINCGYAVNDIHSRLGVVCLDIRTVQYF